MPRDKPFDPTRASSFHSKNLSLVDFIKRPGVVETTIPHLVHNLLRMLRIPTPRPGSHAQRRSPPHTLLQLLRNTPLSSCEELSSPSTLSRERARANLRASRMPQIMHSVHLKPQVIISMHHLMRQRILQMSAIPHLVRADQNAVLRIKAAALLVVAFAAHDAVWSHGRGSVGGTEQVDVVFEEAHDGTVREEPFFVGVGAGDVAVFVYEVFGAEVGGALGRGGAAGEDGEEGGPGVVGCVVGGGGLGGGWW